MSDGFGRMNEGFACAGLWSVKGEMKMRSMKRVGVLVVAGVAAAATAGPSVSHYDDLTEGFYGTSFSYNGVTYSQVNGVSGVFPSGDTFGPGDLGGEVIVENAALLYNDFPDFGSPTNGLTFGTAFVPGDNLSLGALATVTMDLDQTALSASLEMAYYENGPWGGIVYHLDAFAGGSLVASDSFTIADGGGRDNVAIATLSVGGAAFDSMQLYATYGADYSGPRILLDNLTVTYVPTPGGLAAVFVAGAMGVRRRR